MQYSGQILPADATGYFCLLSEDGRHPIRVVSTGDFLIGSGPSCDLRLGTSDIPEIHTVVVTDGSTARLTARVATPPIYINGHQVTNVQLSDGDLIELGGAQLLFRFADEDARITLNEREFVDVTRKQTLSAAQLVEQIERELNVAEELQHTPEQGVRELMAAAKKEAESLQQDSAASAVRRIEQLLVGQQEASRIRLESITDVLNSVVRQQQLIADALQSLSDRVMERNSADPVSLPRRASA